MVNRLLDMNPEYSCNENNQFREILAEIECCKLPPNDMRTLNRISITVSSNLHINSFMYEPIIDLRIETLKDLYSKVKQLKVSIE